MNPTTSWHGCLMRVGRWPGLLAVAVLLAACGGGDGGGDSPQQASSQQGAPISADLAARSEQRIKGAVSVLGSGGYMSVRGEPDAVQVRHYDANGRPEAPKTRLDMNAVPGGQLGSITALAQGGYVLTWLGPSPNPSARWDADYPLIVQRYAASGAFLGAEQVGVTQPFSQRFPPPALPQVAALPDGGYVLAWAQYADAGFNLYARRYAADGLPAGLAQRVTDSVVGPLNVVASAGGGYLLAWGYTSIFARAYGPDDTALGPVQAVGSRSVSAGLPADQRTGLAALAGGGAVVTWADERSGLYVHARRLATDGAPLGEAFIVDGSTLASPGLAPQTASSVAGMPDGGYVVAWLGPDGAIYGRRFAADGSPLGSVTRLNKAASDALGPTVGASGSGFAVTWNAPAPSGGTIAYIRFFDASGLLGAAS
ncbi:MAG: hypothetical protein M3R45_06625 [Pseudomonadota bacterium]|nr:hypothetical protein [Pseudomonadota bacterium]